MLEKGCCRNVESDGEFLFCFLGRIPRLSLIRHSLYVGVIENPPLPPITWHQYGKMEPKYPEGGTATRGFYFNNSVETAAPFNVVSHPRCCEPRN